MLSRLPRLFLLSGRELAALTLLFVVSLPAVTPRLYSSDEVQYYSYLRSLWFDRDVSFENEYRYFYEHDIAQTGGFHETFLERQTPAGRRINFGTIGSAILWAPFFGVADAIVRITDVAEADGFSKPYVRAVAYGSAFYGFLAVLLSIRAARRVMGGAPDAPAAPGTRGDGAMLAGLGVWLGTPLLFYMYVAPPFAHACSAFAVALFVTVWLHARRTWSVPSVVALGLAGALMAMVREQDVFFLIGPALDFVITQLANSKLAAGSWQRANSKLAAGSWQLAGRSVLTAGAGILAFVVGFLPQLLAYNALNGRPGPSQLVTRKMLWHAPHALKVLASPEHGFLVWTPLALLALAGLAVLAFRPGAGTRPGAGGSPAATRRVGVICLVMFALQVYVNGSVDSWSAAGAFGHRRFVAVTILLVIGVAALWKSVTARPRARAAVAVLIALCVWWNAGLIALFGTNMMDRQRIEPARNAYDVFVTLPTRAPALLYRYVTDRESFYRATQDGR